MVIHDHRDISENVVPFVKNKWKLVTIRKTVAEYLKTKYNLESLFLYHLFYPYSVDSKSQKRKKGAVSISRISFEKNTDIIIKANNLLRRREDLIKLYGCASRMYVHLFLNRHINIKSEWSKLRTTAYYNRWLPFVIIAFLSTLAKVLNFNLATTQKANISENLGICNK
jgi:hypothetical protein